MERSLTSVFEKHLGFPGAGRARVTAEAFVDRVVDRLHRFDDAADDLARWVEHFFETEHLAEDRRVAFSAFAEGRQRPVLEVSLSDQEFVVVDSDRDDEVVVVSGAGSMVVQRTAELVSRLRAAELPAPQQHRLGDAFRPAGERVYLVSGQGTVTALDAKAVMAAIRAAPMRAEPVARVTTAATHLPAFTRASAPSSFPSTSAPAAAGGAAFPAAGPRTYAAREMQALARRDSQGTGAGTVRILERGGEVRSVSGAAARVWQSLTSHATDQGRKAEGTAGGVTAVSVGQQTFAVKAGGLTALVQRPVQRGAAPSAVDAVETRSRADRVMPAWLRELLAGAVRGHYWIEPAAGAVAAAPSTGWVALAMDQARAARARVKSELSGELDPAPAVRVSAAAGPRRLASVSHAAILDASVVVAAAPAGAADSRPAAQYRLTDAGAVAPPPLGRPGALPATTLRALFTALERSAAYEGRHLRTAVVTVEPGAPPQAMQLPATQLVTQLAATQPPRAHTVSRVELDTVSRLTPQLPSGRASVAAASGQAPVVSRGPEPAVRGLFSLPFAESGRLRIGPELDVVMARAFAGGQMAPVAVPATLETLVRVSGSPERVRIEVPDLRRTRPRVVAQPGALGVDAVDISALGELQWSTYAARSSSKGVRGQAPPGGVFERYESRSPDVGGVPFPWSQSVPPEMDFAAPQDARQGSSPGGGASATALGSMTPAAGSFGGVGLGLSSLGGFGARAVGDTAQPLYVEPALATSALPLAQINFRRTPLDVRGAESSEPTFAYGADADADEPGSLHFDIPLPLHAQMSAKTLPVYARTRASGPIGQRHSKARLSQPASSSAHVDNSGHAARAQVAAPAVGAVASGAQVAPVAKPMPSLRRTPRDPSRQAASQVLVERPVASAERGDEGLRAGAAQASSIPQGEPRRASSGAASPSAGSAPVRANLASPAGASSRPAGFDAVTEGSVTAGAATRRTSPAAMGTEAFSSRPPSAVTAELSLPAFEAVHVLQQSDAAVRPRRRGATPLRFRYPTSARWWGESSKVAGKAGYAGRLAAAGAAGAVVAPPAAGEPARAAAVASSPASRAVRAPSTSLRRAAGGGMAGAASTQVADPTFVQTPSVAAGPEANTPGDYAAVGDRDTAYVVLNPDGHAQVMNARAASQVTRARAHGAPVDMAVVAAVPPTAPTLEQMAIPGHDRPHAKAKKDQPKAGAIAKTDAMSLQGTVDSLAQRIYHRLRRRLEADRERFGG